MVAAVLILLSSQPLGAGPLAGNAWLLPLLSTGRICWLFHSFACTPSQDAEAGMNELELKSDEKSTSMNGSVCSSSQALLSHLFATIMLDESALFAGDAQLVCGLGPHRGACFRPPACQPVSLSLCIYVFIVASTKTTLGAQSLASHAPAAGQLLGTGSVPRAFGHVPTCCRMLLPCRMSHAGVFGANP